MADDRYAVPLPQNGVGAGLDTILSALRVRNERKREEADREMRAREIKNEETRISNEEARRRAETERQHRIELANAVTTAVPMLESQPSLAKTLLGAHGITATPEMGQPTVFTPAMALAAANKPAPAAAPTGNPVSLEQSPTSPPVTPMNVFGRQGEHAGTTVPDLQPTGFAGGGIDNFTDDQRRVAAENVAGVASGTRLGADRTQAQFPGQGAPTVPPPDVTTGGHAEEDLLPMTEDAKPTGAMTFKGPGGTDLGRFDPAEKHAYETAKAGRVKDALGPLGESYTRVAEMIAHGDISEAEGKVLMSTLAQRDIYSQKAADKDRAREDEQLHKELMAKLYRNEPLTFEMMKELARIRGQYGLAASGMVPTPPGVEKLVEMKNQGFPDEAITAAAVAMKIPEKLWSPIVQNTVKNATAAERAGQKREQLVATDAHGKQIGMWSNPVDARIGKEQNEAFQQVETRMKDLIEHVKKYGNRIGPNTQEYQDRISLGAAVNAALRPYNKLGATDASQKLEAEITGALGAPGHGWLFGANPEGLERILRHAVERHDFMLKQRLRPGGGSQLPGALGGPGPGNSAANSGAPTGGNPASQARWVKIPARRANDPKLAGKTEILVDASGNVLEAR